MLGTCPKASLAGVRARRKHSNIMFEIVAFLLLTHQPLQPVLEGNASFYKTGRQLQVTASGERLKDDQFTCAMREGVFGEYYQIVAENGKSVVCKLNDRGPYKRNRVVDLSKAAMRALDLDADLVKVKIYRLGTNPPTPG